MESLDGNINIIKLVVPVTTKGKTEVLGVHNQYIDNNNHNIAFHSYYNNNKNAGDGFAFKTQILDTNKKGLVTHSYTLTSRSLSFYFCLLLRK